jgi:hypothetical protein
MQTGQSIAVLGFKTPATNLFTDAVESPPSFSWGGVDVDTPDLFFGGFRMKDIYELLRRKELEISRLEIEVTGAAGSSSSSVRRQESRQQN